MTTSTPDPSSSFVTGAHSIGSMKSAFLFGKELSGLALRGRMVAVTVLFIGLPAQK